MTMKLVMCHLHATGLLQKGTKMMNPGRACWHDNKKSVDDDENEDDDNDDGMG